MTLNKDAWVSRPSVRQVTPSELERWPYFPPRKTREAQEVAVEDAIAEKQERAHRLWRLTLGAMTLIALAAVVAAGVLL